MAKKKCGAEDTIATVGRGGLTEKTSEETTVLMSPQPIQDVANAFLRRISMNVDGAVLMRLDKLMKLVIYVSFHAL